MLFCTLALVIKLTVVRGQRMPLKCNTTKFIGGKDKKLSEGIGTKVGLSVINCTVKTALIHRLVYSKMSSLSCSTGLSSRQDNVQVPELVWNAAAA